MQDERGGARWATPVARRGWACYAATWPVTPLRRRATAVGIQARRARGRTVNDSNRNARTVDDSEETLMLRAGTGDQTAYQVLVERYLERIVAFAQRTLGNRSDAEDAAQDVFLRVWSAAPQWKRRSARFATWLHRVAVNVCLDRIAKKREALPDDVPEPIDHRSEPLLALHIREVGRHVSVALAALPETQRLAVTLCYYLGLHRGEAADVMGVSVDAFESLLARGRRAMRAHLCRIAPALLRND